MFVSYRDGFNVNFLRGKRYIKMIVEMNIIQIGKNLINF